MHPKSLPPTSATAKYHSLQTYDQVQAWKGVELNAEEWGWKVTDGKMTPVQNDLETAPQELFQFVRCNTQTVKQVVVQSVADAGVSDLNVQQPVENVGACAKMHRS